MLEKLTCDKLVKSWLDVQHLSKMDGSSIPSQIGKKTPRQCLLVDDGSLPMRCQALRNLFFECKRSMLDNRQRFRGRKGY